MSVEDYNLIYKRNSNTRNYVRMGINGLKRNDKIRSYLEVKISTPVTRRVKKLSIADPKSDSDDKDENEFRRRSESYFKAVNQASFLQSPSTKSPNIIKSKIVPISPICENILKNSTESKNTQTCTNEMQSPGIFLI